MAFGSLTGVFFGTLHLWNYFFSSTSRLVRDLGEESALTQLAFQLPLDQFGAQSKLNTHPVVTSPRPWANVWLS